MRFENLSKALDKVRLALDEYYMELTRINEEMKASSIKPSELVDLGIVCRFAEEQLDERRKDSKATRALAAKLISLDVAKRSLEDPRVTNVVQGTLGRAEAEVKIFPALPKAGTKEYEELLAFFKVPESVVEAGVFKLDWENLSTVITTRVEDGLPIPANLKTYTEYGAKFVRR